MTSTLTGLGEQASVLAIAPRSIDAADGHVVRWALSDELSSNKQTMASSSYGRDGGVPLVGNWDTDPSDEVGCTSLTRTFLFFGTIGAAKPCQRFISAKLATGRLSVIGMAMVLTTRHLSTDHRWLFAAQQPRSSPGDRISVWSREPDADRW